MRCLVLSATVTIYSVKFAKKSPLSINPHYLKALEKI